MTVEIRNAISNFVNYCKTQFLDCNLHKKDLSLHR